QPDDGTHQTSDHHPQRNCRLEVIGTHVRCGDPVEDQAAARQGRAEGGNQSTKLQHFPTPFQKKAVAPMAIPDRTANGDWSRRPHVSILRLRVPDHLERVETTLDSMVYRHRIDGPPGWTRGHQKGRTMTRYCPHGDGAFDDWVAQCPECGSSLVDTPPDPDDLLAE